MFFQALFTPEEEAARRKAHLAKSDKIITAEHNGNQNGTFNKQNHAKVNYILKKGEIFMDLQGAAVKNAFL